MLCTSGGLLVGQEEQQIDIGPRRQRSAAIAADRDDGDALFGIRRIGARKERAAGEIEEAADDLVLGDGSGSRRMRCRRPSRSGAARPQRGPASSRSLQFAQWLARSCDGAASRLAAMHASLRATVSSIDELPGDAMLRCHVCSPASAFSS